MNKKGQLAIFVIIGIVIVVSIILFFVIRSQFGGGSDIPGELSPVYDFYSKCIEEEVGLALDVAGSQGGRIDVGTFQRGSDFAPFSSHLNFAGISIPYWYYVAGNGVIKEQVPSKGEIEREVEEFVESRIGNCNFQSFYDQGFEIDLEAGKDVRVNIEDTKVSVEVRSKLSVSKEEISATKGNFNIEVGSKLGKFHTLAGEVYNKQKDEAFLEEYGVDVLRLYAPVDGVEIECSPKIWKTREVADKLLAGMEGNIAALRMKGDYYKLSDEKNKYFILDHEVDEAVNFLFLKDWPSKIEIVGEGVQDELLIAEPVGNQEGLGVMGFCYVPYHFVYDVSFPVLIQISDGLEIFQFPVSVIIDNNLPREANLRGIVEDADESDVCSFSEGDVTVRTFDVNLNPVEADVSYRCFNEVCNLGSTKISSGDAILNADIPICVNGQLLVKAEGYADKSEIFSSNSQSVAEVILERKYEIEVELRISGRPIRSETAVVHFAGEGGTESAIFPEDNKVNLKEGSYDVNVFVYGDSSIVIPGTRKTQCYEVARGGFLGLFGGTEEECVDIEIPAVNIDYALVGGGKINTFILESELKKGRVIVDVSELPRPGSLEQLQYNYEVFDSLGVDLRF
jgi:hypothetical protein